MKVLVFDLWGDYGHFRKYFTTSSPLTFSFPPKTAIYGLVSAILGYRKDNYLKNFQRGSCDIAIRIINPVKKGRIAYNYINTKSAIDMSKIKDRTQVNVEVLKDCKYRIYFHHKDEKLFNKLKEYLSERKTVYTISLGLSEFIANYKYIGEFEAYPINNSGYADINSIIPFEENIKISLEGGKEYFKDIVYNEMNEKREVTEYIECLFERKGNPISCNIPKYYTVCGGDNIVFL